MDKQVIVRISPWSVFRLLFLTGVTIFGLGGILLGILEKDALGILGGAFLGLIGGLCTATGGAVYCAVVNLFAPIVGGIEVEFSPSTVDSADEQPEEEKQPAST